MNPHLVTNNDVVTGSCYTNVYVAGCDTHTIQRLHSDGTVDCVVLNEGDGVKHPLSICFNKSCDKLYLANKNSSCDLY
jgi:hypothetical protein